MAYITDSILQQRPRTRRRRAPQPNRNQLQSIPMYPVQPLGETKPAINWRPILIAIAVVVAIIVLFIVLDKKYGKAVQPNKKSGMKKMSTTDLAKNLYERLEKRGGASKQTMNSLRQLKRRSR